MNDILFFKFHQKFVLKFWTFFSKIYSHICISFFFWRDSPHWTRSSPFTRFLDHTQWRNTIRRTPLYERSACRRDLYLTTQHSQQTDIQPLVGFEPIISAGGRPQTYALDRAATGTGVYYIKILTFELLIFFLFPSFVLPCVFYFLFVDESWI
jgi:hypothetical protein